MMNGSGFGDFLQNYIDTSLMWRVLSESKLNSSVLIICVTNQRMKSPQNLSWESESRPWCHDGAPVPFPASILKNQDCRKAIASMIDQMASANRKPVCLIFRMFEFVPHLRFLRYKCRWYLTGCWLQRGIAGGIRSCLWGHILCLGSMEVR